MGYFGRMFFVFAGGLDYVGHLPEGHAEKKGS